MQKNMKKILDREGYYMIHSKKELKEYLINDKNALGIKHKRPRFMTDFEWRYEIILRKAEFYNIKKFHPLRFFYLFKLRKLQLKYQTFIPMYTCGKGLSIAHIGGIRINSNAKLGEYCRIQEGVTIGATNGSLKAPQIGNKVYIGSGAKIIGDIYIKDDICIGAGAVVIRSICEDGTYAGVPSKKISDNTSELNLII